MGQSVLSPHTASRAKGRASLTFPSRRPSRPCVLAARLRRCEPPPSKRPSKPLCSRRRLQLCLQQPFRRSLPVFSCNCSSERPTARFFIDENRPAWGAARRRVSSMKTRGLRCGVSALVAPSGVFKGGLRWAGGGSHRLAVPGRARRLLTSALTGSSVTLTRSRCPIDARCWTQRRPPAGLSGR